MQEKIHNKLVRDKIINIIESNGEFTQYHKLDRLSYINELNKKLQEEVKEYIKSNTLDNMAEELADILEVIYAILDHNYIFREDLERIRQEKFKDRGGFQNKIFLEKTYGKDDLI